jgi:hypothetical protein
MNNFVKIKGHIINLDYVTGIYKGGKKEPCHLFIQCVGDQFSVFQFSFDSIEERDILYSRLEDLIKPLNLY